MSIGPGIVRDTQRAIRMMAETLVGPIVLAATDKGVIWLEIRAEGDHHPAHNFQTGESAAARIADRAVAELGLYFRGELRDFSVSFCLDGLSEFQRRVLEHLVHIPFGQVETYGEVALKIGKANSARAVGGALARNPIAIMIPCHRVVAYDGQLHGFLSPEGIHTKAKLLRHEGIAVRDGCVKLDEQSEV